MSSLWHCLESVRDLVAVPAVWHGGLGKDFAAVRTAFLRRRSDTAKSVPCPLECGCAHEVVAHASGKLVGVCRCESWDCEDLQLMAEDVALLELNWSKLGRAIATALGCEARETDLGLPNTIQVGALSGAATPIVLTIQNERAAFRSVVAELVARLREPFVLLAPTGRLVDGHAKELLANGRAVFLDLASHLAILDEGGLRARGNPAEWFASLGLRAQSDQPESAKPGSPRFALRKGLGVWTVTFDGADAELKDERGLAFVAYLLRNPPTEPIHGVELAACVTGSAPIQEMSLGREDAATMRAIRKEAAELAAVLDSEDASEMEKGEARERLEELAAFQKQAGWRTETNAERTVRAVRRAIQRLHERLVSARDEEGRPHLVLRAFAEHLEKHLLIPSSRYSVHKGARTVAGVAGCFTYEPPDGVTWAD